MAARGLLRLAKLFVVVVVVVPFVVVVVAGCGCRAIRSPTMSGAVSQSRIHRACTLLFMAVGLSTNSFYL